MNMLETLQNLLNDSGFVSFFADGGWKNLVMIAVSCLLLYLGIKDIYLGSPLSALLYAAGFLCSLGCRCDAGVGASVCSHIVELA